jgi:hypothetical protein
MGLISTSIIIFLSFILSFATQKHYKELTSETVKIFNKYKYLYFVKRYVEKMLNIKLTFPKEIKFIYLFITFMILLMLII